MADIKAFKGVVYNEKKIGEFKNIVAPPYDVISPTMQDYFYSVSPFNIVRLILGKQHKTDTSGDNRYTRAKKQMDQWMKKRILKQDPKPGLYVYRQIYIHKGKKCSRTGFFSLMKIERPEKSGVLPHENTLAKPKADRLSLIKKVKANLSPIFALYNEKGSRISKMLKDVIANNNPVFSVDFEGVTHQIWNLTDKKKISAIKRIMKEHKVVIADGHHRYEVSRMYRDFVRKTKKVVNNTDYVMTYFTNINETENVTILATHRLLKNIKGLNAVTMISKLRTYFDIKERKSLSDVFSYLGGNASRPSFGVFAGKGVFLTLTLKKSVSVSRIISEKRSVQWKRLDVTILHNFIINKILSLKDTEDNIKYVRAPEDAVKLVRSGDYGIAFFLNPTKAKQVKDVAEKGDKMPQKSTYFYPKLLTGLVINKF